MPITNVRQDWQYLNEYECFRLWNDLGTVTRAQKALKARGVHNPDTGNPPARRSVQVAAMRYIANHLHEARQAIIDAGGKWAEDDDAFLVWAVTRVHNIYITKWQPVSNRYNEFIQKYNLEDYDRMLHEDEYIGDERIDQRTWIEQRAQMLEEHEDIDDERLGG